MILRHLCGKFGATRFDFESLEKKHPDKRWLPRTLSYFPENGIAKSKHKDAKNISLLRFLEPTVLTSEKLNLERNMTLLRYNQELTFKMQLLCLVELRPSRISGVSLFLLLLLVTSFRGSHKSTVGHGRGRLTKRLRTEWNPNPKVEPWVNNSGNRPCKSW
jgi:hypothetical protein